MKLFLSGSDELRVWEARLAAMKARPPAFVGVGESVMRGGAFLKVGTQLKNMDAKSAGAGLGNSLFEEESGLWISDRFPSTDLHGAPVWNSSVSSRDWLLLGDSGGWTVRALRPAGAGAADARRRSPELIYLPPSQCVHHCAVKGNHKLLDAMDKMWQEQNPGRRNGALFSEATYGAGGLGGGVVRYKHALQGPGNPETWARHYHDFNQTLLRHGPDPSKAAEIVVRTTVLDKTLEVLAEVKGRQADA
jgi:hypothetical protein